MLCFSEVSLVCHTFHKPVNAITDCQTPSLPLLVFLSSPGQGLSGGEGHGVARATIPTPLSSIFGNL